MLKLNKNMLYVDACDVSYWQGNINTEKMYSAGIRAAFIRAGYGTAVDRRFVTYINDFIKTGIEVGVYWFIYAASFELAKENAKKCIQVIEPYKDKIKCGVWADWEYDSDIEAGNLTNVQRTVIVKTFLTEMEKVGYDVGIYSDQNYIQSGKFTRELISSYPLWFARYSDNMGSYANKGKDGMPYIWQYTARGNGSIYGVESTTIDLDRCYIDLSYDSRENIMDAVQKDDTAIKADDNPYPEPVRVIYYNPKSFMQRGDDVKWVQWHLWRFGLMTDKDGVPDASKIDGIFGPDSSAALKEAQRRLGLLYNGRPDGKCGPKTRAAFKAV